MLPHVTTNCTISFAVPLQKYGSVSTVITFHLPYRYEVLNQFMHKLKTGWCMYVAQLCFLPTTPFSFTSHVPFVVFTGILTNPFLVLNPDTPASIPSTLNFIPSPQCISQCTAKCYTIISSSNFTTIPTFLVSETYPSILQETLYSRIPPVSHI